MPPGQVVISVILAVGLALDPVAETTREPDAGDATADPEAPAPAPTVEAEGAVEEVTPVEETSPPEMAPAPAADTAAEADAAEEEAHTAPPEDAEEDWDDDDEDWSDDEEAWVDDYDPLRDSPEALEAQRRVAGGAALVGLGALASLGALAMGLSDPCARPAGNSCAATARNRAALTMGLPGVAILGAGVAVLAIGLRQRKALRVGANASPEGASVVFTGRF